MSGDDAKHVLVLVSPSSSVTENQVTTLEGVAFVSEGGKGRENVCTLFLLRADSSARFILIASVASN